MIDKFLKNLSVHPCSSFLADSKVGLEKESLRVDKNGTISSDNNISTDNKDICD